MFDRSPAMKLCVPFIVGIIIGWYWSFSFAVVLVALVVMTGLILLLWKNEELSILKTLILIGVMISLGVLKIMSDGKLQSGNSLLRYVNDDEQSTTLIGVVQERPVSKGKTITVTVEAESLLINKLMRPVEGNVIISLWKDSISQQTISALSYGRHASFAGIIQLPTQVRNPGDFDYRRYLMLKGIHARLYTQSENQIHLNNLSGIWILIDVIHPFREWIRQTLDALVGGEEANLLKGLVIGEQDELAPDMKLAFTNAGLMHILAVSGLNVALVTIMLWSVFSLFRFHRKVTGLLTIFSLAFFCVLTGGEASVMRAVIMASVLIGGKIFEQKSNLYNVVAIAAFIILLANARWLFDVGFQLSFVAVVSLAYLYPKLQTMVEKLPQWMQVNNFIKEYFFLSMAVSLAATIGTLPFTAYYFHKISIIGIVMNLVAVPLSGLILLLGCLVVLAAAISMWLGSVYASAAYASAWILLKFTEWGGNLRFSVIPININLSQAIGLFLLIIILFEINRPYVRRYAILGLLLVGNFALYTSLFAKSSNILRTTMIDVGQGDAILVELPNGMNILVDAGMRNAKNPSGDNRVTAFLSSKQISTIDAFVITHPHADHMGGAAAVLNHCAIKNMYECNAISKSQLVAEFEHDVDSMHIHKEILYSGQQIVLDSNVRLYVFHPFHDSDSLQGNLNNHSVVIKLVYNKTSMLLCGDAEEPVEEDLTTSYGSFLHTDVIKAGHHGSNTSSSIEFLNSVHPKLALISVGNKNKFHHPSPKVMDRYDALGCKTERTDKHGAIILESDGNQWHEINWRDD